MSDNNEVQNGMPSRPEEFKRRSRRVIELPASGLKMEVRRLLGEDFLPLGLLPAGFMEMSQEELEEKIDQQVKADPIFERELKEKVVCACAISPQVVRGPMRETPEEAVHVMDVGNDLDFVYLQIMSLSGLTEETAAKAAPFSGEPVGGGPGPDGPEMEPEPDRAP